MLINARDAIYLFYKLCQLLNIKQKRKSNIRVYFLNSQTNVLKLSVINKNKK